MNNDNKKGIKLSVNQVIGLVGASVLLTTLLAYGIVKSLEQK